MNLAREHVIHVGERAQPEHARRVEQASAAYRRPPVLLDPWQATGVAHRLRERDVHVDEYVFSASSVGRLASSAR